MVSPPESTLTKGDTTIISNPFTPVRKVLLRRDRSKSLSSSFTSATLGKRRRHEHPEETRNQLRVNGSELNLNKMPPRTSISPHAQAHPSFVYSSPASCIRHDHQPLPVPPNRLVALQIEDPNENAIIITALDRIPFCCHEDLVSMSRSELVAVALDLNSKLPAVLRIDIGRERTPQDIRRDVEALVGITTFRNVSSSSSPPPAPKGIKSRRMNDSHSAERTNSSFLVSGSRNNMGTMANKEQKQDRDGPGVGKYLNTPIAINFQSSSSPIASPLRKRTKLSEFHGTLGTPRLARLEEAEEDDEVSEPRAGRALKKRRITSVERPSMNFVTNGGGSGYEAQGSHRLLDVQTYLETPTRYSSRYQRKRSYDAEFEYISSSPVPVTSSSSVLKVVRPVRTRSQSEELPDEMRRLNVRVDL